MSEAHVVRVDRAREAKPNGWWGIALFVATEATLFGTLIGSYFYLRFNTLQWPPPGVPEPKVVVPLVLTAVLVATSVPMHLVSAGARAGRLAAARRFLALALVVQCGYFAYEAVDFHDQIARFDISRNAYSSIYYVLLGADHAHVLVGILLNVWLPGKLTRGLTRYRVNAAHAIAWYWYAVNALTVFVVLTLLSARL